jgi:large subunit ribosomal protein L24
MAAYCKCLQHNSLGENKMQLKNPGKQRKNLFNAPAHIRHKQMAAPLSRELSASKGVKTLPVRKGDTVRIMRGDNKGFEGKVSRVDLKGYRLYMEGLTREKVDGTNIFLPIHPSKVEIRNLSLDDKFRKEILARKVAPEKSAKKAVKSKAKSKKAEKAPAEEVEKEEVAKDEDVAAEKTEEAEEKEAAPKVRAKKASAKGGE